jgi:hypothetical protein
MADRIFLRLNDRLALGADDLQWILYRSRARVAPDLDRRNWREIAFASSTRDILARCVRESGFGDDLAASAVSGLSSTFSAWKTAKSTSPAAPEHEMEHA